MTGFTAIAALAAGYTCHLLLLNRGEHHLFSAVYISSTAIAAPLLAILLLASGSSLSSAILDAGKLVTSFLSGIIASTLVFRLFLNPLNKFPGPFPARLSSFWLSAQAGKKALFRVLQDLHDEHGDFVRIGSADMSIVHPEAVEALYGTNSKALKSVWCDGQLPLTSRLNTRNKVEHARLRRIWSPAFSDKALRGYEKHIQPIRNKLLSVLDGYDGQTIDVEHWISLYSYDVMGELTFVKSYNGLDSRERHWAIKITAEGLQILGFVFPQWFFKAFQLLPGLMDDYNRLQKFCRDCVIERRSMNPEIPDIMGFLLDPYRGQKDLSKDELNLLTGEASLLIVAGSDTTSMTLSAALMFLAQYPEEAVELRAELAPRMPSDRYEEVWHKDLLDLPHLDALINEVLRLYPGVPSSPTRLSPPGGMSIAGTYIPGGTHIYCPGYVLGRKESIYTQAEAFIPQRWYKYPEMVKDKSAYAPFSIGPYGCIGKPLALQNIRITLARIVMRYDISFAPSSTPNDRKAWDLALGEHFSYAAAPLRLCLKKRQ